MGAVRRRSSLDVSPLSAASGGRQPAECWGFAAGERPWGSGRSPGSVRGHADDPEADLVVIIFWFITPAECRAAAGEHSAVGTAPMDANLGAVAWLVLRRSGRVGEGRTLVVV